MSLPIQKLDVEPEPLPEKFRELLYSAAMNGEDFFAKEFPKRPPLIGDWFREGDLGFVFAPRGVGKTWFSHMMIAALTSGEDLDDWEVPGAIKVCLLDGEMPPDDVQERLGRLKANPDNLTVLHHQILFDQAGRSFQLGDHDQRAALLEFVIERKIKVLVIDNLSSVSNISENDNDEWPTIGNWLLDFRRHGIAVIVVHHAGRNGQMRGASRREDPAFWVIRLDDSKDRTSTTDGARFVSTFTKNRNARQWPDPVDWHVASDANGAFEIRTAAADNRTLVLQAIREGIDRCSDIASELGLSNGAVSKIAAKLEANGQINITGKGNQKRYTAN